MSRSTIPKVRIPTVDEIESSTTTTNFTRFRKTNSFEEAASTSASTSSADPNTLVSTKRKFDDDSSSSSSTKNVEENFFSETRISAGQFISAEPRSGSSSVLVNPRQKGNPLLKFLRNVVYEFGRTPSDFVLGESCCALFLSLRFHKLHSDYVHERLKEVGHQYAKQILLVQVDVAEPDQVLRELNTICFNADWILMLVWSPEEAAELLESYKIYEHKPADFLMGKQETEPRARLIDLLTAVKSITRTDAENLIATFGSLKKMSEAGEEQLAMCPGLGLKKAKNLYNAFGASFLVETDATERTIAISDSALLGEGTSTMANELDDIEIEEFFDAE